MQKLMFIQVQKQVVYISVIDCWLLIFPLILVLLTDLTELNEMVRKF